MPERTVAIAAALSGDTPASEWRLDDLFDPDLAPRQLQLAEALFPRLDVDEVIDG